MAAISRNSTLLEVAAIVSAALEEAGFKSVLSGGAAISIYTDNRYESVDLDFVSSVSMQELATILEPLGFERGAKGRARYFCSERPVTTAQRSDRDRSGISQRASNDHVLDFGGAVQILRSLRRGELTQQGQVRPRSCEVGGNLGEHPGEALIAESPSLSGVAPGGFEGVVQHAAAHGCHHHPGQIDARQGRAESRDR